VITSIIGLAWMPGGKDLIFTSNMSGAQALWRIPASYGRSKAPAIIPAAGDNIWFPVVVRMRSGSLRLAYEQHMADANIWTMDAAEPGRHAVSARRLIASTRMDYSPQLSPDGTRIVFASDRSGYFEIWVCDRDGSNLMQLTSLKSFRSGTPRWSPDGSRIAFDSLAAGNNDIWIVGSHGGVPRRLTKENSNARPSWSNDGQWVYFRSDRGGGQQIWKVPAAGGTVVQLTKEGAYEAFESPDSSLVYYVKSPDNPGLSSIPAGGGPENAVLADVRAGYWALCDAGIYYVVPGASPSAPSQIYFFAFAGRQRRPVGLIEKTLPWRTPGFTVSRDGRRIVWSQIDSVESDLMLVENFH
jgi:dipeptidyl aminopeptidase/acylaminoacyl peptidase